MNQSTSAALIGQAVDVRGVPCKIIAVRALGTVDVMATDGTDRCWRVSGLAALTTSQKVVAR